MFTYFKSKLESRIQDIQRTTEAAIQELQKGDPVKAMTIAEQLKTHKNRYTEFVSDACKYLSVSELVTLINDDIITDLCTVEYYFKYTRAVSLEERDLLYKCNYRFKDSKVK